MSLKTEIQCVEETIRIKEQLGKDASFEKGLVEEWKKYLPDGVKRHLWLQHSYSARHQPPS